MVLYRRRCELATSSRGNRDVPLGDLVLSNSSFTRCSLITRITQVIVENVSQPTLDNLYEALGKAYGIPATRVWAIKHNWSKHEWVRLTREMGVKKVRWMCGILLLSSYCGVVAQIWNKGQVARAFLFSFFRYFLSFGCPAAVSGFRRTLR